MRAVMDGIGRAVGISGLLLLTGVVNLGAQQPPQGLSLREALSAALHSATVQISRSGVEAQQGALIAAGGRFAPVLSTEVSHERVRRFALAEGGAVGRSALRTERAGYTVAVGRQLRNGIRIEPEVAVQTTATGPQVSSIGSAVLNVDVPLLKDRAGAVSGVPERTARVQLSIEELNLSHAASMTLREAAAAYWDYVASTREREIHATAVARAERLVRETGVLVQADERPAADLDQFLANAASKRVSLAGAELSIAEVRRRLAVSMGSAPGEMAALAPPSTPFPEPPAEPATESWMELAIARRADLAAAQRRQEISEMQLAAGHADLRARLDLSISIGYWGLDAGSGAYEMLLSPLYRHVPGPTASVALRYQVPVGNATARGQLAQSRAAHEQQRIAVAELHRRIAAAVVTAAAAMKQSREMRAQAGRALDLTARAVEHQRTRYKLGMATLFDVILAEDALTAAEISALNAQRSYAAAVLSLRFETATLVDTVAGEPVLIADRTLAVP